MGVLDDLREKNKNTLSEKEKMWREIKKTPKKIPQIPKAIPESPQRKEKKTNGKPRGSKHKLDAGAKAIQETAFKTNAFPQAVVRFNERLLNDGVLAPVSIPYQIATGKKFLDFGLEAETDSAQKGAAVGNFLGTAAAYGTGYGAAGKGITKGAEKILATGVGKKATAKLIAGKIGKKYGKETAEKVAAGIARNTVGDATVGTLMNLSHARGEGLKGEALAKDMAINAAMDFGLGSAFEFAGPAAGKLIDAVGNLHLERRLDGGKQKNIWTKTPEPIPRKTYKVSHSGNVNQRLGAKEIKETLGSIPTAPQPIPYAPGKTVKTLTPEAQERIFKAVEKRSGAKITYADLPSGIDGTYQNGVITISNSAKNPAYTVLRHELTHHIETSGHYAELSDFIQNSMRDAGYDVDQSLKDIISDYAAAGKQLTAEEAQKEFTAKFAEEYLFNSEKSIERLARENPSIFRQIYDWIVDTLHKIGASDETKFLIEAQRKYEKALWTVGSSQNTDAKYLLAGSRALNADRAMRQEAEAMLKAGKTPREIWEKTGWKYGLDRKWRFEIDDSKMKFFPDGDAVFRERHPEYARLQELYDKVWDGSISETEMKELDKLNQIWGGENIRLRERVESGNATLEDVLQHNELFGNYPQLRKTNYIPRDIEKLGRIGGYLPDANTIEIEKQLHNDKYLSKKRDETVIHEIQHAIQNVEGFERGGDHEKGLKALREAASNALEKHHDGRYKKEYQEYLDASISDALNGTNKATEYIDNFLMKEYNVNNIEQLKRIGYSSLLGEREAENAAERLALNVSDRRTNYPDYERGAITHQTYSSSAKSGNIMGQGIPGTASARLADEDIRKGVAGNAKRETENAQFNGKMDGRRSLLGADRVRTAGNEPAFSLPLEARVSGDALLDAQDTVDLVKDIGGKVDENGYVTLYHRTSKENAEKIRSTGKMSAKEDGVFFSTSKTGYNDGYGDAVVELKVPAEKLVLDDIFDNEAHFKIPLENRNKVLDVAGYRKDVSMSIGDGIRKDELLDELRKASESLYGETGNKYMQEIPLASKIPLASEIPKKEPQPIPRADSIPDAPARTRRYASDPPDVITEERWKHTLENAPGERLARGASEEEWEHLAKMADEHVRDRTGVTQKQIDGILRREEKVTTKTSQKAKQVQNREIREADLAMKEALGINKYSDNKYIKEQMNLAVEKMKDGSLTRADKDRLFNEMFAEGIVVDQDFALRYQDLKKTIRQTQLSVSERVRRNIADFDDFRRANMNKVRMSNTDGAKIDIFYDELRASYPELFPELNTEEEMLEKIADVASSIKVAETRVSADVEAEAIYAEARKRFDEVMDELEKKANIVKQYVTKRETDLTTDEMLEFAGELGKMKRNADKVKSKILLSDADQDFKNMLLKGKMTPDQVRRASLNSQNIFEVYAAEKPVYEMKKAIRKYGQETKDAYKKIADDMLASSDKWNDKIGLLYARETPERNFVDIAGKETGERINKEYFEQIHEHEAAATRMKSALRGEVRKLNISTEKTFDTRYLSVDAPGLSEKIAEARAAGKKFKISEAEIVQLYGEKLIEKEAIEELGADFGKIQNAVDTMRKLYNQLLEAANNVLLRHGYEPIEFRKDYFPHFTEEKPDGILAKAASALGINIKKDELPTDINGLTHTFRPGKKWFGHAFRRTAEVTEYDAIKGFDIYLEGISDVIHHTEDIQKLRALVSELRYKYSSNGIKERVREVRADADLDDVIKEITINGIYDTGNTKLGSLATWLTNYTDQLAGKKSQFDRVFEQSLGRTLYNTSKAIENRVAANMVALNPASWLTNFIPLVQAGELSPKYILQGMAETVQNGFRKADNIADMSSFLTNRKGSDVLWKSGMEKAQDVLTKPMELIDRFTSQALVRAKYAEQIAKGVNPEDAIKTADRFAADIIAARSKGALPTMFNSKNPVSKILTMYQVEVNNQWSHLLKDIPRSKENVAKVALAFTNFAIGAYIFNDVYEFFVGRRPDLDPISWVNDFVGDTTGKKVPNFAEALWNAAMKDEEINLKEVEIKKGGAAVTAAGKNIAQDIPFVGGILGGGRVPISSALPSVPKIATNLGNLLSGDVDPKKAWSEIGKEAAKPAFYIAPPIGGGQIKKVIESGIALKKGGSYGLDNDGQEKLRFAVDPDAGSIIKGLLFGQYAIGNADDYVESGFKMLSAKKSKAYQALVTAGMKNTEAEKFVRSLPGNTSQMRTAILNSNLTTKQKQAVGNALDEKQIDYSSKESYADSFMKETQKEALAKIKKSGISDADARKIYELTKGNMGGTKKVNALLEAGYREEVMKRLGIKNESIERGKALYAAGIDNDIYTYTRKRADANKNGNLSKKEVKAYLDKTAYTRKEKFALMKAITGCKDKNNPYR